MPSNYTFTDNGVVYDMQTLYVQKQFFDNSGVYACGLNDFGQLGIGDTINRSSPVQVGTTNTWAKVALGNSYTLAIKTDGTLWACGYNSNGSGGGGLGLGDTINRSSPVQVGSLTNWAQVSASGLLSSYAIKTDGTLWAWGNNANGSLGLGNSAPRSSPVQVGTLTNWAQVSGGQAHTAAIKTDGTLWTWGSNGEGQLGLGDSVVQRSSPVQVGSLTNWAQVSSGQTHKAAIKTDGTLWTWGYGIYGMLGLGDQVSRSSPVQVGSLTNWKQVSSTSYSAAAIKTDGTLWTWGYNGQGQLGLNDVINRSSPVQVGSLTNWKQVVCHSPVAAIKTDGTLWTWGDNGSGVLGFGQTFGSRSSPVQVGTLSNWREVALSPNNTMFALKSVV